MPLREGEPGIDVPDQPFAEMILVKSVLTPSHHRKGQGSTLLLSAKKRNFRRVGSWGPEDTSVTPAKFEMFNSITLQPEYLIRRIPR